MNYLELLASLGLTVDTVSVTLKRKIKQLEKLKALIAEQTAAVETETSARKKKNMQNELEEANSAAEELEADIVKGINRYAKNAASYKAAGEKLNGRKKAASAPAPTPDPTPDPAPQPDPEPTPDPDPEPEPDPTPDPAPQPDPEPKPKKKKSALAWFGVGVLVVASGLIGYNLYQDSK